LIWIGAVTQGLAYAWLAWAAYLSLRVIKFADISVDGTFTLGASVSAALALAGWNPWLALAASLAAGMVGGTVTGILHTRLGVNDLLSGILVMTAAYSVNLRVMGKPNLGLVDVPSVFSLPGNLSDETSQLIVLGLLALAMTALLSWFLRTDYGIALRATGESEAMVSAQGFDPKVAKVVVLALSNGLAAVSGSLIAQYNGFADISMGIGALVSGIAGLIIGERLLGSKSLVVRVAGAAAGAIAYRTIIALALYKGLNPTDLKLLTAVFVLLAISLPTRRRTA
jgi:putative ABC transport system permease protein